MTNDDDILDNTNCDDVDTKTESITRGEFVGKLLHTSMKYVFNAQKLTEFVWDKDYSQKPDDQWPVLSIRTEMTSDEIVDIVEKNIEVGSFLLKRRFDSVVSNTKDTIKDADKDTKPKVAGYYVRLFGELNCMIGLKYSERHKSQMIILSMDDSNEYSYYKYVFVLAHIFSIKIK
ncbi:hypothetical protein YASMINEVIRUS_212 [Yasminevirus sp. GU-2018]|uniref:Uncharacterized protein n=1 Tax=Yasminevirus sp. GU-2018 TaxID=2420051 RepID=A0A5K0U732_9VIRU|nr:hypothetical protein YASMINEVIRUS_212 [Yasminevirus sp. GU-2018]